jgi:hypothetical protein
VRFATRSLAEAAPSSAASIASPCAPTLSRREIVV